MQSIRKYSFLRITANKAEKAGNSFGA